MREGRNGGKLKSGGTTNGGRPKKLPALKDLIQQVMADERDGVTAMEAVFMQLRAKASKGDMRAIQLLLEYAYGKPKQVISNDPDNPFTGGQVQLVLVASGVAPIESEAEAEIIPIDESKALPNP